MKRILLLVTAVMMATLSLRAQNDVQPYLTTEQLPDLIKCLPAPPAFDSPEFANDLVRYAWGKQQRTDPERAAIAKSDAVWEPIDTLFHLLSEPFGLEVTAENTPEIYTLLLTSLKTTDPMRKAPKAYYHRLRPFEYLADAMLTGEEAQLSGEGSYPSGHTMRGQTCALLMSQIAPRSPYQPCLYLRREPCHRWRPLAERRRCQPRGGQHCLLCPSRQRGFHGADGEGSAGIQGKDRADVELQERQRQKTALFELKKG